MLAKKTKSSKLAKIPRISHNKNLLKQIRSNKAEIIKEVIKEIKEDKTTDAQPKKKNIKPTSETVTRRERRSLKIDSKKHSEVVRFILPKWEILRREDTDKDKKFELVETMMKSCNKTLPELCFAHDTSRIVESMIQYGTERQQYEIFQLLSPKLIEMCETPFGRFVAIKLLSYCKKDQISHFVKLVSGNVAKLLTHKYSSEVVELIFNEHANAKERCQMLQELYGNRDLLGLTNQEKGSLSDAIKMNQDKRQVILTNVNEVLIKLVSKNLTNMSIIQRLLLEYITAEMPFLSPMLPGATEATKLQEMTVPERVQVLIDAFVEHSQIVPMLHTREGVRVALCFLWLSNPKTKKGIVKSLKTAISSISMNEHGYIFIIGMLDFVDDSVLLEKTVIKELLEDLQVLVAHPHARKVFLYALNPRDPQHFSNQLIQSLIAPGDLSPFTRKPLGSRAHELRSLSMGLLPALLRLASSRLVELFVGDRVEHFQPIMDRGRLILLVEIINQSSPKALTSSFCLDRYHRSQETGERPNMHEFSATEMEAIQSLRKELLHGFVKHCLSPEFVPSGKQLSKVTDKEQNQQKRRKKALALAEEESIKRRKITVPAFTNMGEKKSVRLDDAGSDEETEMQVDQVEETAEVPKNTVQLTPDEETLLEMPWLERPEATPILKKLFEACKLTENFDFLDLVIELVPPSVMRSWTTCNRTCFFVVKMMESGYQPIVDHVLQKVSNQKLVKALKTSDLPGAKVLLSKLV